MKKKLLSLIALLLSITTFAQNKELNDYVLLKSGEVITGDYSRETGGGFFTEYIRMGNNKYKFKDVKGFMRAGIYYAIINNSKKSIFKKEQVCIRVKHGAINLYQPITSSAATSASKRNEKIFYTVEKKYRYTYYLQKGENGEYEKINTKNIQSAVKSSKKSTKYADIYAHKEKKSKILKAVGLGSFGGSLLFFGGGIVSDKGQNAMLATSGLLLATSIVTGIASGSIKHGNPTNLFKAIDVYNKENLDTSTIVTTKQTDVKTNNKKRESDVRNVNLGDYDQGLSKRTNWSFSVGVEGFYATPVAVSDISKGTFGVPIKGKVWGLGAALNLYPKYNFLNTKKASISAGIPFSFGTGISLNIPFMVDVNLGNEAKKITNKNTGYFFGAGLGYVFTNGVIVNATDKTYGSGIGYDENFKSISNFGPNFHIGATFKVKTKMYGPERHIINGYRLSYNLGMSGKNSFIGLSTFYKF